MPIVHTDAAAQSGISFTTPFEDYLRNCVVGTHQLLEACRRAGSVRSLGWPKCWELRALGTTGGCSAGRADGTRPTDGWSV